MQRLGQLILCLILLLSTLLGLGPALGTFAMTPNFANVGVPVTAVNAAPHMVPLALVLIFATLILLSTPRGSGQDQ